MRFLETQEGRELANQLLQVGVIKFTKSSPVSFTLEVPEERSYELSNGYFCKALGLAFAQLTKESKIDVRTICGIPDEGIILASGMIHTGRSDLSLVCMSRRDDHGCCHLSCRGPAQISENAEHVLLLDDIIVDGQTKLEAIKILRGLGYIVEHLLVVIDTEQGGVERVVQEGVQVHALFRTSELLELIIHVL